MNIFIVKLQNQMFGSQFHILYRCKPPDTTLYLATGWIISRINMNHHRHRHPATDNRTGPIRNHIKNSKDK